MGRPSALTVERREAVEKALAAGAPLAVAAASAQVTPRTVSRWLAKGRVVRRQLAAAPEPEPGWQVDRPSNDGELDVERALVATVLRASQRDWRAAIALLRWREQRRRRSR
jgi:hypothetical protein